MIYIYSNTLLCSKFFEDVIFEAHHILTDNDKSLSVD